MHKPVDIRYRHMEPSPALTSRIHAEVEELERLCGDLVSCRVTVEQPHHHQRQGNAFRVMIDVHAASIELVVGHTHRDSGTFEDAHRAVAAQFEVVRRRLVDALAQRRDHQLDKGLSHRSA
ncbi:MAG: HPF/RaiA family ribosome-associated protein [Myxococcota bacterium]|nr:HPF/RaiA family ribosome-associated protein [Myxococcota bacterium]